MSGVYMEHPKIKSHLAKFGCGNGSILVSFFQNFGIFFRKSGKIQKKLYKLKKNQNEAGAMYYLMYIFFQILLLTF